MIWRVWQYDRKRVSGVRQKSSGNSTVVVGVAYAELFLKFRRARHQLAKFVYALQ